jgi:hypothetical protein
VVTLNAPEHRCRWNDVRVTPYGGEPQDLDDIDKPPEGEPEAGPIKSVPVAAPHRSAGVLWQ